MKTYYIITYSGLVSDENGNTIEKSFDSYIYLNDLFPNRKELVDFLVQTLYDSNGIELDPEHVSINNIIPLNEQQFNLWTGNSEIE